MSLTLTEKVLRKYVREAFFETGTHDGGGIDVALKTGFQTIYSCDSSAERVARASERFAATKVQIFEGNSEVVLAKVLPTIGATITFWLDAHDDSASHEASPLLDELSVILTTLSVVGRNVILIDDMRRLGKKGTWGEGLSIEKLLDHIRRFDPSINFKFEENRFDRSDILAVWGTVPLALPCD